MKRLLYLMTILSISTGLAQAKLNVVTTTTDLRALTQAIAGNLVNVSSIAKGTQDPHYIEAKPSYMLKISHADLVIAQGLELEIGYLPSLIRGARNPNVVAGKLGYLELGSKLDPIEIPTRNVTRAEGDVHPFGNPHFTLDPIRMGQAGIIIAQRLGELDAEHASMYLERAQAYQKKLVEKTKEWMERIQKSGVKKIVEYHKTLNYFFDRFHLNGVVELEPKPGIPPTSSHIIDVIQLIKQQHVKLVLVENYFDSSVTKKIENSVPSVKAFTVPVSVDGATNIKTLDDLYENLVQTIEKVK